MSGSQNRRVLFVDDEKGVLEGLARLLHKDFEVATVESGLRALGRIRSATEPFAVVVSDERMPVLNGAGFLARAKQLAPDSVRMLLTGQASVQSAIDAVNDGNIFRFLCKPCPPPVLRAALEAGVEQHNLVVSQREVMERTLPAVVRTLADVLSLAAPDLFNRASVVKQYVSHVVRQLALPGGWQIEVAASLHTLGLLALPGDLAQRAVGGLSLTAEQRKQVATHPETGERILAAIPRLEDVAAIVAQQMLEAPTGSPLVVTGARLLRVASRLEARVASGHSLAEALDWLWAHTADEDHVYVEALRSFSTDTERMILRELRARELLPHMILAEDVRTRAGALVVAGGRELTTLLIEQLKQFAIAHTLEEPVRVRVPVLSDPAEGSLPAAEP